MTTASAIEIPMVELAPRVRRRFDESKVKRNKGRFAKKAGTGVSTPSANDHENPEATVFKPHADGAVTHVSDDGDQRMVYNADAGTFTRQYRENGGPWETFKSYDKNDAHKLLKSGWRVADESDQIVPETPENTPGPADVPNAPDVAPSPDMTPEADLGLYADNAFIPVSSEFPTRDGGEMDDMRAETFYLNPPRMSEEQKRAVNHYTANGYIEMNDCLRTGQSCTDEATVANEQLASAMRPLLRNTTVFRATNLERLGGAQHLDDLESLVGSEISDNGFSSTSLDPDVSSRFGDVAMQIEVPAGAQALFPGSLSNYPSELEMILPPETRFRVLEVVRNTPSGRPTVRLQVIP